MDHVIVLISIQATARRKRKRRTEDVGGRFPPELLESKFPPKLKGKLPLTSSFEDKTKYNKPLASVNGDSDDDRYDKLPSWMGAAGAGQPATATGPLRSATRL